MELPTVKLYTKMPHCPACSAMILLLKREQISYSEESDMSILTSFRYVENAEGVKYTAGRQPEGEWSAPRGLTTVPWIEFQDGRILTYKDAVKYFHK